MTEDIQKQAMTRILGLNRYENEYLYPARTPGVLGINDHGDPSKYSLLGDTPGPKGICDFADPNIGSTLTDVLVLAKLCNISENKAIKYNKVASNGIFGSFKYRDIPNSDDAQIEVDPVWVSDNIVKMMLPPNLQKLPEFNGIKSLRVNKHVLKNWEQVFTVISNNKDLLNLISSLDPGTFYPRHIRKKVANGISNHAWGTAIDINAVDHPLHSFVNVQKEKEDPNYILFKKVFKPAGFSWGNDYKDPMHFEITNI